MASLLTTAFASIDTEPRYDATAVLLTTGSETLNPETLAQLAETAAVAAGADDELDLDGDADDLLDQLEADADKTGFVNIIATAREPEQAEAIANAFAEELIEFVTEEGLVAGAPEDVETTPEDEQDAADRAQRADQLEERIASVRARLDDIEDELAELAAEIAERVESASSEFELLQLELFLSIRRQSLEPLRASLNEQLDTLVKRRAELVSGDDGRGPEDAPATEDGAVLRVVQEATAVKSDEEGLSAPESKTSQLLIASVIGLFGGAALALILERVDTRLRTSEAAGRHFAMSVLAEVPDADGAALPALFGSGSAQSDAFRLLAAAIETSAIAGDGDVAKGGEDIRKILVTSAGQGEGKTTVVANLAAALAEIGNRVIIVSSDLRHPDVEKVVGAAGDAGLAEAIRSDGEDLLYGNLHATQIEGVQIIPAGASNDSPARVLGSAAMARLVDAAAERADIVLLDSSPLLVSGEGSLMLKLADALLVVARLGTTTSEAADRTKELLTRLAPARRGLVVTGVEHHAGTRLS